MSNEDSWSASSISLGILVGVAGVAVIRGGVAVFRADEDRTAIGLLLVLPVMASAWIGRVASAVVVAICAAVALSTALPPIGSPRVRLGTDIVALIVFVVVALASGGVVAFATERRKEADAGRKAAEEAHEHLRSAAAEQERLSAELQRVAVLEEIDKQRAALLRSVSHDLRSPLVTIRAAASGLLEGHDAFDPPTRDEMLELVVAEAERLDRIVANVLNLSRAEAGALLPKATRMGIDDVIVTSARRHARLFGDHPVRLDIDTDLPDLDLDEVQIDQVLTNLFENAVRHAPPGTDVTVRARRVGGDVEVAVTDDGPGVDLDLRPHLFEPFRAGADGSSGVGLAICKAIVEAHGGTIALGENDGRGTRFVFTIPVPA